MIQVTKKRISISKELRSKIEWACAFCNCKPKINNGNLRMLEHTNIAYVEPHRVVIKDKLYLFFNEHEYFYINNLESQYPISKLGEIIKDQQRKVGGDFMKEQVIQAEKKVAGIYIRVSTEDQARERIQFRRTRRKVASTLPI